MPDHVRKSDLALAHRIFAFFQMDDLTYAHLSIRSQSQPDTYYISPLGLLFEEVTSSSLVHVDFEGRVLSQGQFSYNQTGFSIHGSIYRNCPHIQCVMHLHSTYVTAVSSQKQGLLPLSQFSFHFYNRLSYHSYDGLVLDEERSKKLVKDLGGNKVMILRNHGALSVGRTVQEAFFYMYYLEKACQVQCKAQQGNQELIIPSPAICEKAAREMEDFETEIGSRDWQALKRKIDRLDPTYQD